MKGVMSDRDGTTGGLPIDPALDAALGKWFYQAPMALVCTDLQLRVVRVNDAFCQLLGLSADEMIGRRPSEYSDTFDAEFIERTVAEEVIRKGLPLVDVHLTQRLPDGHERALAWSVFLLVDDE